MPTPEINYRAASDSIIRADWDKTRLGTISAIASHFERFKNDRRIMKAMYNRAMIAYYYQTDQLEKAEQFIETLQLDFNELFKK